MSRGEFIDTTKKKIAALEHMTDVEIQSFLDFPDKFWAHAKIVDPSHMLDIVRACAAKLRDFDDASSRILVIGMKNDATWRAGVDLHEFNTMDPKKLNEIIGFIMLTCVM